MNHVITCIWVMVARLVADFHVDKETDNGNSRDDADKRKPKQKKDKKKRTDDFDDDGSL